MSITNDQLIEHVSKMSVLDLANLVKELEEKVQILSSIAGAPSIKTKSDLEVKREENETYILNRLSSLKKW